MIALVLSPLVPLIGAAFVIAAGSRVTGRAALIAALSWVVVGTVWFAVVPSIDIAALQGAFAAATAVVVAALWPGMHRLAVAAWVLLVPLVVAFASFDVIGGVLVTAVGYVDFGSVGVLGVALGVTAQALRGRGHRVVSAGWRSGILAGLAAAAGWLGLLVGAELTVDTMTPVVLAVTAVALPAGLAGWIGVELITTRRVTPASIPAGLSAAGLAIAAGAPWLSPTVGVALGLLAGILGALLTRRTTSAPGRLAALILPPSLIGLLATGLLTSGPGWVNSGQPDLLFSELLGAGLIALWALLVTVVLRITALRRTVPLPAELAG